MNTELPYLIRGTSDWDKREQQRQLAGCACICYGAIPPNQAWGEPLAHKQQLIEIEAA